MNNAFFNFGPDFNDVVLEQTLNYAKSGVRQLDDDLIKICRRVQEHFAKIESMARSQWGTTWLAENALHQCFMQNASLNESEQAAIFIGITRATREIDALHNALSAIADVPNDGSYASNVRLSKLALQRDQADAKLRAAIIKHTIIRTHSGG
jgi:hypothetical protein